MLVLIFKCFGFALTAGGYALCAFAIAVPTEKDLRDAGIITKDGDGQ